MFASLHDLQDKHSYQDGNSPSGVGESPVFVWAILLDGPILRGNKIVRAHMGQKLETSTSVVAKKKHTDSGADHASQF